MLLLFCTPITEYRRGIKKQQKNDGCDVHQRVVVSVYLCICIGAEILSSTAATTTSSPSVLKQDAVYCSCMLSPRPPGRKFQPPGSPINQWRGKKGIECLSTFLNCGVRLIYAVGITLVYFENSSFSEIVLVGFWEYIVPNW
jgi:hypothetical protein